MPKTEPYTVFISHAAADLWVARQLSAQIEGRGASTFLDEFDLVELNRIEPYFEQLKGRIERLAHNG